MAKEQLTTGPNRAVQAIAGLLLCVAVWTDYGVGAWKTSPWWVYPILGLLAAGVRVERLREAAVLALISRMNGGK